MAELEAEAFLIGHWKNFEELEENISLAELTAIVEAVRNAEFARNKFAAALKGINLDEHTNGETNEERFERIKRQAEAELAGKSADEYEFEKLGFGVESD